ncbi:MAG: hypothetical protein ACP5KY_09805 [Thermoproteus sp.]
MRRGLVVTLLVAITFTSAALINTLMPPLDFLEAVRSGVYTAYFPWGLVSADGSHAYIEIHGYQIAVNLWKAVICDPSGVCRSQDINALSLYLSLKSSGTLVIQNLGGRCYDVSLKPFTVAGHSVAFAGQICLNPDGSPRSIDGTLTLDGQTWRLSGGPTNVVHQFLMDRFNAIFGS